ncbi:HD domain-containing phosphohydrolase [Rhodopseudomonas palustris]|uniref:HD-GYP domain-containing protein n=1 Tax=Rhodopseudomonas palustris TaxID=1076 RepID=UPI002ACEAAE2|nr:HD domain-containing phosphohydrolase [Rhodopseudomonas palustris]WQG99601.1 HD domain-containing phosphohydrolase [Rhodopseudomonas palustris]
MLVHVIAETPRKISTLRLTLPPQIDARFTLLGEPPDLAPLPDALVVAVDIRVVGHIAALKDVMRRLGAVRKRVFLIDGSSHLLSAQAYALGATRVLHNPVSGPQLAAHLVDQLVLTASSNSAVADATRSAAEGAAAIASMFVAAASGDPVDMAIADVANRIADSVIDHGLANWLSIVRRHHEGTFQHCLLVTGVAVDFGQCLGVSSADIRRLSVAAMFHDLGKASIPRAVLDKPGKLDPAERMLVETHAHAGHQILMKTPGVSPEVLDAVRHHHEFLDGSGYPDGLSGAGISDLVRLLTISDIFAALIEERRYKPPMARDQAYEVLLSMRGKLEAPLVAAFRQVAFGQ